MSYFKKICIYFWLFLFVLNSSCIDDKPEKAKIAHRIIKKFSKEMFDEYGLIYAGLYESGGKKGYKELGLDFDLKKVLTKQEGRKILLDIADRFLEKINSNPDLKQYLLDNPFTYKNIQLTIFSITSENHIVYYPDIFLFSLLNGQLRYKTKKEGQEFGYYTEEYETIEEAKKLVESQANNKS